MMVNKTIKLEEEKMDIQTRRFEQLNINPQLKSRIKKNTEFENNYFLSEINCTDLGKSITDSTLRV